MLRNSKLGLGAVVAVAILLTGVGMYKANAYFGAPSASVTITGGNWEGAVFGQAPSGDSQGAEMTFGSSEGDTTVFTAVSTTQDMGVGRNLYVVGTSTFVGNVAGVAKTLSASMSSSATTTACFITPSIASRRVITGAGVINKGTAASLGAVAWTVGTSTVTGTAPTGVKVVNTTLTRVAGVDVITTTSTPQSVYTTINPGESLIFVSGTTTNAGNCWATLN